MVRTFRVLCVLGVLVALLAWSLQPRATTLEGRGGKLRLDRDLLSKPEFSPLVTFLNWALRPWAKTLIPLDELGLVAEAQRRANLSDFWPEENYWRGGLRALLHSLNHECGGLSFVGRFIAREMILGNLRTQLQVVDAVKRHPEILAEEIREPIILAGLPRTGSTHLHRLLGEAHPDTQFLPHFEAINPVAPPGLLPEQFGTEADPRLKEAETGTSGLLYLRPLVPQIQRIDPKDAFEEMYLGAAVFGSQLFQAVWQNTSTYDDWWARTNHTAAYAFIRRCLQVLQWQRGDRRRWVLKTPQNAEQLGTVMAVFPDAKVVATHRDPTAVMRSLCFMLAYFYGVQGDRVWLDDLGVTWKARTGSHLRHFIAALQSMKAEQVAHVNFEEFMADQEGTIERLARWAGLSGGDAARSAIARHLEHNPRHGSAKFEYSLALCGLAAEDLDKEFAFYASTKFAGRTPKS